jgi:hypothetical protein
MTPKVRKTIEHFVNTKQEFKYLIALNDYVKYDIDKIVDYALDAYNYELKDNVPIYESKIQSLYLTNIYLGKIQQQKQCCYEDKK